MAHENLMDAKFKNMLKGHDDGYLYAVVENGALTVHPVVWDVPEGTIPRELLLVAYQLDLMREEESLSWERSEEGLGVRWHDENKFVLLENVGISKEIGFYVKPLFPNEEDISKGY